MKKLLLASTMLLSSSSVLAASTLEISFDNSWYLYVSDVENSGGYTSDDFILNPFNTESFDTKFEFSKFTNRGTYRVYSRTYELRDTVSKKYLRHEKTVESTGIRIDEFESVEDFAIRSFNTQSVWKCKDQTNGHRDQSLNATTVDKCRISEIKIDNVVYVEPEEPTKVPEPVSLLLLGVGALSLRRVIK